MACLISWCILVWNFPLQKFQINLDLMCDMFTLKLLKVKNRVRERERERKKDARGNWNRMCKSFLRRTCQNSVSTLTQGDKMFRSNTRYIGAVSQKKKMWVYALLHTTLHLHFCHAFTSTAMIFTHFHTPTRIQVQKAMLYSQQNSTCTSPSCVTYKKAQSKTYL